MDQDTARRVNALLGELGDLLDPVHGRGRVLRAYALAQNSMAAKAGPGEAMAALAAELRSAAIAADGIAAYAGGKAPEPPQVDLIALADGDLAAEFEACSVCGSTSVAHRGLYIGAGTTGNWLGLAAWCAAAGCQEDRARSLVQAVPVARTEGGYRVVDAW